MFGPCTYCQADSVLSVWQLSRWGREGWLLSVLCLALVVPRVGLSV